MEQKLGSGVRELKIKVFSPFPSNLPRKALTKTKQIHGKFQFIQEIQVLCHPQYQYYPLKEFSVLIVGPFLAEPISANCSWQDRNNRSNSSIFSQLFYENRQRSVKNAFQDTKFGKFAPPSREIKFNGNLQNNKLGES